MAIKSVSETVRKWQSRVAVAEPEYVAGVREPTKDWQEATLQAEANWNESIQKAAQERAFAAGVQRTSTQEWQQQTLNKAPRWREGVGIAAPKYGHSMETVLANVDATVREIESIPKGPKGSDQNITRAVEYMKRMHEKTSAGKALDAVHNSPPAPASQQPGYVPASPAPTYTPPASTVSPTGTPSRGSARIYRTSY